MNTTRFNNITGVEGVWVPEMDPKGNCSHNSSGTTSMEIQRHSLSFGAWGLGAFTIPLGKPVIYNTQSLGSAASNVV